MLYQLFCYLREYSSLCNVVHYVSFRASAALLTALFLSLLWGEKFIESSKKYFRAKARQYAPENHKAKDNMPTMGGLLIGAVVIVTTLLWCDLSRPEVWLFIACLVLFGAIGFWDDWSKICYHRGISERAKFRAQLAAATVITLAWLYFCQPTTAVCIPFFKNVQPALGWLIIPWAIFILVGTSNAVNLTDGLDGLAIGSLLANFATFSLIAYLAGHSEFAHYLSIPFMGTSEVAIIGVALFGASLGFLWYNTYPAQIFMGDVGSLALGAALALMALVTRQELLLVIAGGLFVAETMSVILQVFFVKVFKRRLFRMAPLHHHFELLGWQEAKITVRFAIITFMLCVITLMTLKLR